MRVNEDALKDKILLEAATSIAGRLYPLTLWLDYRVPSWNRMVSQHWTRLHREKLEAKAAVGTAILVTVLGGLEFSPPRIKLHVILTMYRCRLLDADNAACKCVIDQLRYANLLKNDDPDSMALTIQQVKVKTKAEEGTKLVLTEMLP